MNELFRVTLFLLLLTSGVLGQTTRFDKSVLFKHWQLDKFEKDFHFVGNVNEVSGYSESDRALLFKTGSYAKVATRELSGSSSYSVLIDFKIPNTGRWYSFLQLSPDNKDDGELFINPNGSFGVGEVGYSRYSISSGEWYRMVVTFGTNGLVSYYLDGHLSHKNIVPGDRFKLGEELLFFADDNGEDGPIMVSNVAIFTEELSPDEVRGLKGFGHKISTDWVPIQPNYQIIDGTTAIISWKSDDTITTLVNYGTDISKINLQAKGRNKLGYHQVRLEDLNPGKEYFFQCVSGWDTSNVYSFQTLTSGADSNGEIADNNTSDKNSGVIVGTLAFLLILASIYGLYTKRRLEYFRREKNLVSASFSKRLAVLEELLHYKEQKLWENQLNSDESIILISKDNLIQKVNHRFRECIGHEETPLTGMSFDDLLTETGKQEWDKFLGSIDSYQRPIEYLGLGMNAGKMQGIVDLEVTNLLNDPSVNGLMIKFIQFKANQNITMAGDNGEQSDLNKVKKELAIKNEMLARKNELLQKISNRSGEFNNPEMDSIVRDLKIDQFSDQQWDQFQHHLELLDENFTKRLGAAYPALSNKEQRYCIYIRLKLSTKEIAGLMNISPESVKKARYRISKKVNLPQGTKLASFLEGL